MAKWFRNTTTYQKLGEGAHPFICIHCQLVTWLFVTPEQKRCFAIKTAEYRCRRPKTYEKEETCAARAIPKSTITDLNKWGDFW